MRPPASTRPDCSAAGTSATGWLEKSTNATNELSATVAAIGPIWPSVAQAYAASAVAAIKAGSEWAASAPMKLVADMPSAATTTAVSRVR